jgi:hypothetical protein
MNAWVPNTVTLQGLATVPASQTDYVISKKFPITAGGSKNLVLSVTFTASAAATYAIKLRTSFGAGSASDAKSVSVVVAAPGIVTAYYRLNSDVSGDQSYLPLASLGEVVMTTPAGATAADIVVQSLQEE